MTLDNMSIQELIEAYQRLLDSFAEEPNLNSLKWYKSLDELERDHVISDKKIPRYVPIRWN